jgi:pimeloyl-ACP methyl ester carboxylesterase
MLRHINAGVLEVGYEDNGPADGTVVILLHGFPYDIHAYDDVTPLLVEQGCRVINPWLRGYGATRFLSDATLRSGQQGALAADLLALMDALDISTAVLAGYDWGGRAACIVSALWPERVQGLWLQHPGYSRIRPAGCAAGGIQIVVPVLFSWRAWPHRAAPAPR